jgi:hypothetical protein
MPVAPPVKPNALRPPPTAALWTLWQKTPDPKNKHRMVATQLRDPNPGPDGQVPEMWSVAEFSAKRVLEVWGAGLYRVEWYASDGKKLAGQGMTFEVAEPTAAPTRGRLNRSKAHGPAVDAADVLTAATAAAGAPAGGIGIMEMLQLFAQRDEKAERREERARQEAQQAAAIQQQRDREFIAMMFQALTQRAGESAGGVSPDLIRREINVGIREGLQQLQAQLGGDGDDDDDVPGDPPASLEDAGKQLMGTVLQVLQQKAPTLIQEIIAKAQAGGLTAEQLAALEAQARGATNGRAHAS